MVNGYIGSVSWVSTTSSGYETMKKPNTLWYLSLRYISYPRTETNIFPKDLNLVALVEQQTLDPHWGAFAQTILERGGPNPRNGNKSDQAHPPIHPTKYTSSLQVGSSECESCWNPEQVQDRW